MWKWIRIPKGIALVAFVLPWLTVSCSGTKIVSATGFGIAFGRFTSELPNTERTPGAGEINYLILLALIAVAIGLAIAFTPQTRQKAAALIGTSVGALVLIWAGTLKYSKSTILAEAAKKNGGQRNEMSDAALAMIQIDWQFGYWLAILALLTAGVMAWLAFSGRGAEVEERVRSRMSGAPSGPLVNCPQCGKGLPADTRYCPDDGTPLI
ncbi:zinc ribbon domain-containing protein [Sphingomonas sp. G-3-2-10]|uniref:zinc ribbon domain-containing protein n=1 Tax=Sphingomonas sp. G-3-2-10 TaxID=2728838 RepID=UPI00146C606A|nr:zinc ribbon domain-containing protein [Sphingomonas sp. G-3-2-10]NML04598.1 zinc ribbon domain-containing protein [Sphingomonas sp. G-3-2-10]